LSAPGYRPGEDFKTPAVGAAALLNVIS
jgi:hypothetical protein